MEQEEQIYVNVEELRDTCCTKHQEPEDTETKPERTDFVAGDETETCSSFKVATVCLGLLCFVLLTAVIGVGVQRDRDYNQLSRDLANHTAEKHQLLVRYHNLTDERDQLKDTFKSTKILLNTVMKKIGKCPDGWSQFGCRCYSLSTTMATWDYSRQECLNRGAELVIVNSQGEMVFLNTLGDHLKFWIGLSKSSTQSNWMWTDGSSLRTAYWQHGHPSINSFRTKNCASFNSFKAEVFEWMVTSWSSEFCGQYLQWVCEREAEVSLL